MRKILPYLLILFIACTACNSDDTAKNLDVKISDEEKELLIGKWQLVRYLDKEGGGVDFLKEGFLVNYTFYRNEFLKIEAILLPEYMSPNLVFRLMTETKQTPYVFYFVQRDEGDSSKKEMIGFLMHGYFDLDVTENQLILTYDEGESFILKRVKEEVHYPEISQKDKALLKGSWRLKEISDFSNESRIFNENEEVLYYFDYDSLSIKNENALDASMFERFIQNQKKKYLYRYDFEREKREVVRIEDLGNYVMEVSEENLILSSDNYILKLERNKK